MPEPIPGFILIEGPVPAPVRISLHIPRSGQLPADHCYFKRNIRWIFIEACDIEPAKPRDHSQIDTRTLVFYQEIYHGLLEEIAGIPAAEICRRLNGQSQIAALLKPAEQDLLLMQEYFVYEHVRNAPKRMREHTGGFHFAAFRFSEGQWTLLSAFHPQWELGLHSSLLSGAAPNNTLRARSGILQWR